jgi:histidinol dehydrogenase
VDEAALRRLAPDVTALAAAEGLAEHARAVALRAEVAPVRERAS